MTAASRTRRSGARGGAPTSAGAAATGGPTSVGRVRRLPWWALAASLVLFISAGLSVSPIRNASTYGAVPEAHLVLSTGYLILAPICDVFDTLSLMSVRQHVAIVVTLVVLYAAWRVWRGMHHGMRLWREVGAALLGLVGLVAIYAAALLVPRPMAALTVETPFNDLVLVADFHSHTSFSHDGAPWFSPEANRRWHHDAGYDVVYITDHRTVQGAEAGLAANPPEAGEGTMILQGLEAGWDSAHVNVLGAERMYRGITDPGLRDVDDTLLALASLVPNHEPIVVFTFPGQLRHLHAASGPGTAGVRAIEIVDGSPRGLGATRRLRARINAVADSLHLALVSGTDNHGWGYTAPAWTLVEVPGWRGMSTDSLAAAIDAVIRTRRLQATRVVERRVADTGRSLWRLVATLPLVAARMTTTLSDDERVSWLIWIWGFVAIRLTWRRRRHRESQAA